MLGKQAHKNLQDNSDTESMFSREKSKLDSLLGNEYLR